MTTVRAWSPADRARWDDYVRRAPDAQFGQLSAWKDVTERGYGCTSRWWYAERDGAVAGVLPLFRKRGLAGGGSLVSAPGGMLADDAEAAAALLARAAEEVDRERLEWLELRDQLPRWPGLPTVEENVTFRLDLPPAAGTLWDGFGFKMRNHIRKGQKSGFTVLRGHQHVAAFHRVMLENMRDLGTPILGPGYFRDVLAAFGEAAHLIVLDKDGVTAGAILLIEHAGTLHNPWTSSLRRYFKLCPNHVLYWEALQLAVDRGCRRFDFGRSQWGSNTFVFKEQWGAVPVPLHYQYRLGRAAAPPTVAGQKHALDVAVKAWQRLPVPVAAVLGPLARRRFPEAL